MERKIHEKLKHLTGDEIDELIKRYYQGENVAKLIKEYKIDTRPQYLVTLFPSPESSRLCPYCNVKLTSIYKSRRSYYQVEHYCIICHHNTEKYPCNCNNCKAEEKNRSLDKLKKLHKNENLKIPDTTIESGDFMSLNTEPELYTKLPNGSGKFEYRTNSETFLKSGISQLDCRFQGFMPSTLNILAGRHSMGKTTIGLWICYYLKFKENVNVAIFSMEMTKNQVLKRLGFAHLCTSDTPSNNHFDRHTLNKNFRDISNYFIVRSSAQFNIDDLYESVLNRQIDFLFIDNIHRMNLSPEDRKYAVNREQEISKIVRDLKSLATKLRIPILAISQINRDIESRQGHFPMIQDLKDSGTIENDADLVFFVHRPEIYGITEDEDGNNLRGLVEISIAKNRFDYFAPYAYNRLSSDKFAFKFCNLPH